MYREHYYTAIRAGTYVQPGKHKTHERRRASDGGRSTEAAAAAFNVVLFQPLSNRTHVVDRFLVPV